MRLSAGIGAKFLGSEDRPYIGLPAAETASSASTSTEIGGQHAQ